MRAFPEDAAARWVAEGATWLLDVQFGEAGEEMLCNASPFSTDVPTHESISSLICRLMSQFPHF